MSEERPIAGCGTGCFSLGFGNQWIWWIIIILIIICVCPGIFGGLGGCDNYGGYNKKC